jgi:uracil-DNA glycosylase family 4
MGVRVWRLRTKDSEVGKRYGALGAPGSAEVYEPPGFLSNVQTDAHSKGPETFPADFPAGMNWQQLHQAVITCRACSLCETRTQAVFGVGNPGADLMIIGEAPGAEEDRRGEPFVGRAGQLLDLMLKAIGLSRGQVYIANVLKCRPPGNRDPLPQEVRCCQPYLMRQIALVGPRALLSVGRISAQNLLGTDTPLGRLRERWHEFGPDRIPLMVTYHPAYLLRSPDQKSRTWQDLLQVAHRLRMTIDASA